MKAETMDGQIVFDENGELVPNPENLLRVDLSKLVKWRRTEVDCPWCLLRAPLSLFATYIKASRKGMKKLSYKKVECPECHQRMTMKTLMRATNMTVREYAIWFWTSIYQWRAYEKVKWTSLTARIKMWPYADSQTFWDIWRKMSPKHGGMTARQIEEEGKDWTEYEERMKKVDEYRQRQDI